MDRGLKLGFVGAGNMTLAILNGVLGAALLPPEQIWVSNRHIEKLAVFNAKGVHTTTDNRVVVHTSDVVILAVKPQMFDEVLPEIGQDVSGKCMVSIAAGVSTAYLKEKLPGAYVVRAMPNTPLMVGMGTTAVAWAPEIPSTLFQTVLDLFASAGMVETIAENQMDDVINVNGSTPAFFFRMVESLVNRAVAAGLDREAALRMAAYTMEGSARLLRETGKTPEELTKQVCSPGGTTLAALSAFDELKFDTLLREAMRRCTNRSKELGR